MALASQDEPLDDPLSTHGSEPLVPILQVGAGQIDAVALTTWHQALSNTLSVEVPHDLMGLWLYPSQGGVALLGPAELAADDLAIPVPSPHLKSEQLTAVEKIVSNAGYKSATCLPIRFGKRDVALLLVADLQADRYGPSERVLLQCVAQRVAPMLGRIARQWVPVEGPSSRQQERIAGLLEAVSQANRDASSPQRFVAAIARALAPLLPHDHIELLVPNKAGGQYFRLGEHAGGPLWADPSLVISKEHLDIAAIFDSQQGLLVTDTYEDARWPRGFLTASDGGADIRAVIGAQLNAGGGTLAYLLVGSIGPEIYGADDGELLGLLAGLVAPQISGFLRGVEPARDSTAERLCTFAALLAATSDPGVAARLIAGHAEGLLPFTELTVALKPTEGEGVILLRPGERRALSKLPRVAVAGTALGRILQGEVPNSLARGRGESCLIVPLRAAGKVHGALIFSAPEAGLEELHIEPAQRLADIAAADLELLRIGAMLPIPKPPAEQPVDTTGLKAVRAMPATPPHRTSPEVWR